MPFGKRTAEQITFPLEPTYAKAGAEFVHAAADKIDPDRTKVIAERREYDYDYLVIATGYRNDFDVVEGLGPGGYADTITTLGDAQHATETWKRYLKDPGDIVVGATQGTGCFGAAYEFLFNANFQLNRAGLKGKCQGHLRHQRALPWPLRHRWNAWR
jgi:sulfide:quinone oxidoreductase